MSGPVELVRDSSQDLSGTVARFVADHRLPGAAAGVVVGDDLAWSFGYGFSDVESERPSIPTDLYRIASITKTFTATSIMQLRDAGQLDLDDPVTVHLPEFAGATTPFARVETVTLRRLLSHESGLMEDPPGTNWSARIYETDIAASLAAASAIHTRVPPSTQTKYSNLAFQLLGEVVSRRSGMPYGAYVGENLLDPLGMSSTAFEPPPPTLAARCATAYAQRTFSDRLRPAIPAGPPAAPVAEGGLWSSVEDLARWISAQFRDDAAERSGDRILAGPSLREMHRPRYLSDEAWTGAFCIGWYARRRGDDVWIQHSGGLPGFITSVCFRPADRVGAIVLLNGIGPASELAMELGTRALDQVRRGFEPAAVPSPVPDDLAALLGLYMNDDLGQPIRLEWRDGQLTFVAPADPGWVLTLTRMDESPTFVVDPGVRESGEPVTFGATADGRLSSVTIGSDRFTRLERVEDPD